MDESELHDFKHYDMKFDLPYLEGNEKFRWLSDIRIDQSILVKSWWRFGRTYRRLKLPAFPEPAVNSTVFISNGRDGQNEDYLHVLCGYFNSEPEVFLQTLAGIEQASPWPVIPSPSKLAKDFYQPQICCLIKDERSPIHFFDIDLNGWNNDLHDYEDALKLVNKALRGKAVGPLRFTDRNETSRHDQNPPDNEDSKPNYLFGEECVLEAQHVRITYVDSLFGELDENDNFPSHSILLEREVFLRSLQRTLEILISQAQQLQKAWTSVFPMLQV
jgi:hypothetical protein